MGASGSGGGSKISQGAFARKFLENCGVEENRRVARSPLPGGCELRKWDGEAAGAETFDYLMVVGTRPYQWMRCRALAHNTKLYHHCRH